MINNIDASRSAYHLANNPARYQPQRTNNFMVTVSGLGSLLTPGADPDDSASYINDGEEVLRFSVISFDVPHHSNQTVDVQRGNTKIHFISNADFRDGTLVIDDFIGADGKSVLEAWQNLGCSIEDNGAVYDSTNYKKTMTVYEYKPDNVTVVRSWTLYGCFVKGLSEDGWNNESANKKKITATISYDWAVPNKE